jgi:hypothetical protein
MADAVTSQTLVDGPRNVVMKFTNISDGTGESAVTKVNVSSLDGAPASVRIDRIIASTSGMAVNILWDATSDALCWALSADDTEDLCFRKSGGLINNAGAGVTGDINFTTVGAASGNSYSIELHMVKKF